ncbi:MAG: 3-methyl-2-oxobutanoate hydroxymethyltransferase [Pseudomonadota bacterium]
MSVESRTRRTMAPEIQARKGGEPIVCLTAYTTQVAKLLDDNVDLLLVGDSLAMVLYGLDSTLGVNLDMMIQHGNAVMRGSKKACVIVDMPFGSYEESPQVAFRNAARIMSETRCNGVKLEGGVEMAETVRFLAERGVPVLGHIGLTPQYVQTMGGFRTQGRTEESARQILEDAKAISDAGAFAMVVEGTMEALAREITSRVPVPTIGIGASPQCDGQILVTEDVIGLFTDFTPKFVKRYGEMGELIREVGIQYAKEVKARTFPASEHCFGVAVNDSKKTA